MNTAFRNEKIFEFLENIVIDLAHVFEYDSVCIFLSNEDFNNELDLKKHRI